MPDRDAPPVARHVRGAARARRGDGPGSRGRRRRQLSRWWTRRSAEDVGGGERRVGKRERRRDDQVRVISRITEEVRYRWRERLRALAAPRRYGSPDSVFERGISRKLLESCENSLFDRARRSCCAARCSLAHGESLRFQPHSRQRCPYGYRYAIVAIRQAARPERRSISDTHEVEGAAT